MVHGPEDTGVRGFDEPELPRVSVGTTHLALRRLGARTGFDHPVFVAVSHTREVRKAAISHWRFSEDRSQCPGAFEYHHAQLQHQAR